MDWDNEGSSKHTDRRSATAGAIEGLRAIKTQLRYLLILPLFAISTPLSMLGIVLIMADRETAVGYGFIVGMVLSIIVYATVFGRGLLPVLAWIGVSVVIALGLSYSLFRFSRILHTPSIVTFCLLYLVPLLISIVVGSLVAARLSGAPTR